MADVYPAPPTEALDEWRPRATNATLSAVLVMFAPVLLAFWLEERRGTLRAAATALYAVIALLSLSSPRWHRLRADSVLAIGLMVATLGLTRAGLGGLGRIVLLPLPLFALLVVSRRASSVMLGLVAALLAAFTVFAYLGWLPVHESGDAWLLASLGTVATIAPLQVLLRRALAFEEGAIARAREASERLIADAEERQRLEREVIESSERERRTIGHELHDGLCQQLSASLLSARMLERSLANHGAPEAEQAGTLAEVIDAALSDARSLARGLSPGPLAPGGLEAALRELARQVRATVEVDCSVTGAGAPSLDEAAATQLFRIAQEAVQNAVKHAEAGLITIELGEDAEQVTLVIRDDGRGLTADAPAGLGLRSMRGRAVALAGVLEVGAAPGGGTQVICRVPRRA